MSDEKKNGAAPPVAFIEDGYTIDGWLDQNEWYPKVTFTYRPMIQDERMRLFKRIEHLAEKDQDGENIAAGERLASKTVADRLETWDVTRSNGAPLEITEENVGRLEPHLQARLFLVVTGQKKADGGGYDQKQEDIDSKN